MGFGDSFMDMAHGWNRFVRGVYHEGAAGIKYEWNGGDHQSVDDDESMRGRLEAGEEYGEAQTWVDGGEYLMGKGVGGMARSIGGALGFDDGPAGPSGPVCTEDGDDPDPDGGASASPLDDMYGD